MTIQVLTLMPLRTTMNYQYRYGTSTTTAFNTLWAEGRLGRFYRGLGPALIQAPLSRFGDTAANAGALALMNSFDQTKDLPAAIKTIGASTCAAAFRVLLVPVDTVKTIMQVEGKGGLEALAGKVKRYGPTSLFHGALASAAATFAGHWPWYAVFNTLNEIVPKYADHPLQKLARNAAIGFCATVTSDTISNSLRVIKTFRQTHTERLSYVECVRQIVAKDGVSGLMFRGLRTRIAANAIQGVMFSVLWRLMEDAWNEKYNGGSAASSTAKGAAASAAAVAAAPAATSEKSLK